MVVAMWVKKEEESREGGGVVGVAHVDAGQEVVLADHLEVVLEGG